MNISTSYQYPDRLQILQPDQYHAPQPSSTGGQRSVFKSAFIRVIRG
ncbi:hypothetical protein BH09SUM1_BH09SUM1_26770 [soil metagenome]